MSLATLNVAALIAWIVAGVWFVVIAVFLRGFRKQSSLRPVSDHAGLKEVQRLSIVVAARNEEACIETCIRSLFRQDYPDLEVIAVNDRSTDGTAEILDRLAIEFHEKLRVVHVSTLAAGWFGKPHALTLGLKSATGTRVLFTDADCEFQASSALTTAVIEMARRQLDFFTVAARYTMTSLWERVAVPCCSEVLLTWLRPERVEDPRWPDAFANGAFILVRRESFEKIGGWGAVRTKISEDLELARLMKRSGLRIGVAHGEGFYETRSYDTVRDSWNGWSRIFKGVLTPVQLLVTFGRMLVLSALPLGSMIWGLAEILLTGKSTWLTSVAGMGFAVAFGLRFLLDVAMFRLVGAPVFTALLAPLGRLFVMAVSIRALFSHAGWVNTYWRGATFSAGRLVIPRQSKSEPQIQ